jgi:hypothetical protein
VKIVDGKVELNTSEATAVEGNTEKNAKDEFEIDGVVALYCCSSEGWQSLDYNGRVI